VIVMMRYLFVQPGRSKPVFLSCLLALLLVACSSKDIDPETLPAELVSFKSSVKVKKLWSQGVGSGTEYLRLALRPAEHGDTIFAAAHDGKIRALEAESGKTIWKADTELPLSAGPATDGELVVAGSSNGDVIALDAATGDFIWAVQVTSEVLSAPAVAPGKVVVRTVNGKLTALDSRNGEQLWSVQQSMPRLSVRGTSTPVISRNLVICGFDNGRVSAVDLSDGGVIWDVLLDPPSGRTAIERLVDVNSTIQVAGSDVYAVGYQSRLGAIAAESGQLIWSRELSSYSGMAIDFKTIYLDDQRSELLALSRASGRELWRRDDLRNRDLTAPALVSDALVVGDFEGYLHWFDIATGDPIARVRAGSERITSQPLVVNDILYVMNDGGNLYAFKIIAKAEGG
jgi:outer membrane protein assembly factor BamB